MKLKNILLSGLSLVLVAALAIGGTVAYLQDDDSDVNVMTLGNVSIAQHEYERAVDADGNYKTITVTKADGSTQESYELTEFKQAKPLLPGVGAVTNYDPTYVRFEQLGDPAKVQGGQAPLYGMNNVQDKFVLVENTGKTDAYVRTIIAFEAGAKTYAEWDAVIRTSTGDDGEPWEYNWISETVNIEGNNYVICEAIYTGYSYGNMRHNGGILPAGEWTYSNLAQVYMMPTATNEDCEALDGNGNGTYDILVLSQAVQAAGFENAATALDTAFGKSSEKAAEWFGGVSIPSAPFVSTVEDLKAALEAGESVSLATDLVLDESFVIAAGKTATIDLAGNELSLVSTEAKASCAIDNKGTLTLKNGTVSYGGVGDPNFGYGTNTINNSGKLIIDGATIINTTNAGSSNAIDCAPGSELIVNDGVIKSEKVTIRVRDNATVTINGGEISGARAVQIHLFQNVKAATTLTINGGTFTGDYALYSYAYGNCTFDQTTVNISGGTFNGIVAFGGGNKTATETVNITGGTFNGDLGRYLANDGWEDIAKPE